MLCDRWLGFKLVLFFTLSSSLIFAATLVYHYVQSRRALEAEAERNAAILVRALVNRVETTLVPVARVTDAMGYALERGPHDEARIRALVTATLEDNPEIFGTTVALAPGTDGALRASNWYRTSHGIASRDLAAAYDYRLQDWYQLPAELGQPQWSEPYVDEGGDKVLMATYSVPFFAGSGARRRLAGVVTADVALDWLTRLVSSIDVLQSGFAMLVSRYGTLVTHPNRELIMNETLFGLAETTGDGRLREIGKRMIRGESGLVPDTRAFGRASLLYYAPIRSTGWSVAVVFPRDELFADVRRLSLTTAAIGALGILLFALAGVFIVRTLTRPLEALAKATGEISQGRFDLSLPLVRCRDEIGRLSGDFRTMTESLREYVRQLTETTATKERIESELAIAHDIQMGILPKIFPPFPNRRELDLHAAIVPAREVGGDFYDFFETDPGHLCFVVADVSGKGVPAALFMAVTKTLIKANAHSGSTPDQILSRVNRELCSGNESSMFVTLFCGLLDLAGGELLYTNAGHNPPVLARPREGGAGAVSLLPKSGQLVLGAMDDFPYRCEHLRLDPGDRLYIYTDGVTEAMNEAGELFSEVRLLEAIAAIGGRPLEEADAALIARVHAFAGSAPQSDDITLMILEYRGMQPQRGK